MAPLYKLIPFTLMLLACGKKDNRTLPSEYTQGNLEGFWIESEWGSVFEASNLLLIREGKAATASLTSDDFQCPGDWSVTIKDNSFLDMESPGCYMPRSPIIQLNFHSLDLSYYDRKYKFRRIKRHEAERIISTQFLAGPLNPALEAYRVPYVAEAPASIRTLSQEFRNRSITLKSAEFAKTHLYAEITAGSFRESPFEYKEADEGICMIRRPFGAQTQLEVPQTFPLTSVSGRVFATENNTWKIPDATSEDSGIITTTSTRPTNSIWFKAGELEFSCDLLPSKGTFSIDVLKAILGDQASIQ